MALLNVPSLHRFCLICTPTTCHLDVAQNSFLSAVAVTILGTKMYASFRQADLWTYLSATTVNLHLACFYLLIYKLPLGTNTSFFYVGKIVKNVTFACAENKQSTNKFHQIITHSRAWTGWASGYTRRVWESDVMAIFCIFTLRFGKLPRGLLPYRFVSLFSL